MVFVLIFIVIAVLFPMFFFGSLLRRTQKKSEEPKRTDEANIIDVKAIDADQAAEITSTDRLLKP
jgi:Na+-transporting methylmalonyl-CoA/oxaloacetate decarboxylase gamma subunit